MAPRWPTQKPAAGAKAFFIVLPSTLPRIGSASRLARLGGSLVGRVSDRSGRVAGPCLGMACG